MSTRELALEHVIGRRVRDVDGRSVGRITEMRAEIVLHEQGSDYCVSEVLLGVHGWLEGLAGGAFARRAIPHLGPFAGYKEYRIPWQQMDFSDPDRPRLRCRREDLSSSSGSRASRDY